MAKSTGKTTDSRRQAQRDRATTLELPRSPETPSEDSRPLVVVEQLLPRPAKPRKG